MNLRDYCLTSLLLFSLFVLSACGQKGELYLPDDQAAFVELTTQHS